MSGFQTLKKQIIPIIKGLPIIIGIFLLSIFLARQIIAYTPNVYQTIAKIKLDDQKGGFSNNEYYRDLEVFTTENIVESEAEILKSPIIIQRALDSIDLEVIIYRKGKLKNTMLYDESPIKITHSISNPKLLDHFLDLKIYGKDSVMLFDEEENSIHPIFGKIGQPIKIGNDTVTISKNQLASNNIQLEGEYTFKIFSENGLISYINGHLDVKAVDKDIPILRVVFKDEHPKKVADITNAICQAYIDDYVYTKSNAANKTLSFIDGKLNDIKIKLEQSEYDLEQFKKQNNVVNTLQETETGLREISKLKIQLVNLEMNEEAIKTLQTYIENGNYFEETAINFGFGDLLMTELVKKLKLWQDERYDLIIKYKPDSEKVIAIDNKISEIKVYVKEAIKQNLKEIQTKRRDIETVVDKASHMFDELPTREKNQHILERDFRLMEDVYNFLSQKKIEASMASTVGLSFHRVIQPAVTPKKPVSPNDVLITFVCGLLGLIIGITLVFLKKFIRAAVTSKEDIEKCSIIPVAGVIRHNQKEYDFEMIAKSFQIKGLIKNGQVVSVNSTLNSEGRSYVARHLARQLVKMGYTTCLVTHQPETDAHQITESQFEAIDNLEINQLNTFIYSDGRAFSEPQLNRLKTKFDIVLIDAPASALNIAGVEAMKWANLNLYLARANYTTLNYLSQPDLLQDEYKLENLYIILNDAHISTNYNGNYIGSRFHKGMKPKGFVPVIKYYYSTYISK